jgi:histidine triad (HIT) family protein
MADDCIFCKIVRGEVPSTKEYEDDHILAFRDIHPKAPIHILIIPKKHIQNLSHTDSRDVELLGKLNLAAAEIAKKLGSSEQFKLTTNNGEQAGQVVMHLHYHLLSGWEKKEDIISELHL